MRDKNLFHLVLGLNIALAGAFVVFLILSSQRNPGVLSTQFPVPSSLSNPPPVQISDPATNQPPMVAEITTNTTPATEVSPDPAAPRPEPVFTDQKFGWQDVEHDRYQGYLDSLRAVGCPEDKIRYIILADINELFTRKRTEEAVRHDPEFWRAEPESSVSTLLRDRGLELDEQRAKLIARWLGEEAAQEEKSEITFWSHVQLTGQRLGALPKQVHRQVQDICADSMDRYQTIFWSAINSGSPLNQVDLANLRQGTRTELMKVLSPEDQEEFLLRYSHNANRLRQELRGFDPSEEEFRQIFHAIDPLDHAMQLQYGNIESLSPQQRQRHEDRRNQAIQAVLSPARYQAYLLTKDPLYRQAQMMAMQHGAPSSAIMPIYEMTRNNDLRRRDIMASTTMSPEEKRKEINDVYINQQNEVRRIVAEARRGKPLTP